MGIFSKKQWSILAVFLVVLLASVGLRLFGPNPRVERLRQMRTEMFSSGGNVPAAERRERMEAFRKEQEKLTDAERKELWSDLRKRREAELERYSKLSKEEQTKFLDDRIDRMQNAMQAGGRGRPPGGGPGAGNVFAAGGPPNLSAEDRERRRKEMLDSTTPEERALRDQFMKDFRARLAQRGLPTGPWGPR